MRKQFFRLASNESSWVAASQLAVALASLVTIRILTELVSTDDFGRLTLALGVAALAINMVATPTLQGLLRYYPDWASANKIEILIAASKNIIFKKYLIALLVIISAAAVFSFELKVSPYLVLMISILILAEAGLTSVQAVLNARKLHGQLAIVQATNAWVRPFLAIPLTILIGFTAEAIIFSYTVGTALVIMLWFFGKSASVPEIRANSALAVDSSWNETCNTLQRYAKPLAPLAIFGWLNGMGDRYIVAGILSLHEVGLYAAIFGLTSKPFIMIWTVIEQIQRPLLQNAIASGNRSAVVIVKNRMLLHAAASGFLVLVGCALLSDVIATIFLAEEYRSASQLMPWIALGYWFFCISSAYTRYCYSFDATNYVFYLTVSGALIGVAALVPLAMQFGVKGAAASIAIRFGVEMLVARYLAKKAEEKFWSSRQCT